MPRGDEVLRGKPFLKPYVCRVRAEGVTLRGRIHLEGILQELPGIGEVRFQILSGPWEGVTWVRDAGGLLWRVVRTYPPREEMADTSPQIARGVRLEDLLWSEVIQRLAKENAEILRHDPALIRLRIKRNHTLDEFVLEGKTHTPRSWVRWEGEEMILRVFYDPVQEESSPRMIAWTAFGVAVGVVALGLWLWGRRRRDTPTEDAG